MYANRKCLWVDIKHQVVWVHLTDYINRFYSKQLEWQCCFFGKAFWMDPFTFSILEHVGTVKTNIAFEMPTLFSIFIHKCRLCLFSDVEDFWKCILFHLFFWIDWNQVFKSSDFNPYSQYISNSYLQRITLTYPPQGSMGNVTQYAFWPKYIQLPITTWTATFTVLSNPKTCNVCI